MLQYNIPQFIDAEDKIVGIITLRQFAFLAIGVVILGFLWVSIGNIGTFLIFAIPIAGFTVALAFFKVKGVNFSTFLGNVFTYITKPTVYLWSRDPESTSIIINFSIKKKSYTKKNTAPIYNQARVEEIAWTLDTYGQKKVMMQDQNEEE